jgi:hypothetical protein
MGKQPPIIYPKTDGEPVPHTTDNWREGRIAHDLSGDAELAANGDEAAAARLETAQLIELRRRAREG